MVCNNLLARVVNYLFGLYYYFGPSRGRNCVISMRMCDACLPTSTSFSLSLNRLRWLVLGHVSISILMLACLHHSSVLHAPDSAQLIILTALYLNSNLNSCIELSHLICHFRLAEPILVAFFLRCIRHLNMDLDHTF
mgnify:CR=1 FL=1